MSTEHVSPETPVSRDAIVTGDASGIGLASPGVLASDGTLSPCSTATPTVPPRRLIIEASGGKPVRSRGRRHRSCRNRTRRRRGQRAPRAPDHPREQCGAAVDGAVPSPIDVDDWERGPRCEPHRNVPLLPGRDPGNDRGGMGSCREHLVVECSQRPAVHGALRCCQVRGDRVDEIAGPRVRPEGITVNTIPPASSTPR